MEEMKVSEGVLEQMRARRLALNSAQILFQMAEREMRLYSKEKLVELGLDASKQYNVDEKSGVVSEIKVEPVKESESKES